VIVSIASVMERNPTLLQHGDVSMPTGVGWHLIARMRPFQTHWAFDYENPTLNNLLFALSYKEPSASRILTLIPKLSKGDSDGGLNEAAMAAERARVRGLE
jgi:hypothetical protein